MRRWKVVFQPHKQWHHDWRAWRWWDKKTPCGEWKREGGATNAYEPGSRQIMLMNFKAEMPWGLCNSFEVGIITFSYVSFSCRFTRWSPSCLRHHARRFGKVQRAYQAGIWLYFFFKIVTALWEEIDNGSMWLWNLYLAHPAKLSDLALGRRGTTPGHY